jgi:CheY-like chemotaxis protein
VLLIEPDRRVAATIVRKLARSYTALVAHDAADALERLQRGEQFDVILCDADLAPSSEGSVYRRLSPTLRRRVVFLSDNPENHRLPRPCLLKPAYTLEVQRALSLADLCLAPEPSRREATTTRVNRPFPLRS